MRGSIYRLFTTSRCVAWLARPCCFCIRPGYRRLWKGKKASGQPGTVPVKPAAEDVLAAEASPQQLETSLSHTMGYSARLAWEQKPSVFHRTGLAGFHRSACHCLVSSVIQIAAVPQLSSTPTRKPSLRAVGWFTKTAAPGDTHPQSRLAGYTTAEKHTTHSVSRSKGGGVTYEAGVRCVVKGHRQMLRIGEAFGRTVGGPGLEKRQSDGPPLSTMMDG